MLPLNPSRHLRALQQLLYLRNHVKREVQIQTDIEVNLFALDHHYPFYFQYTTNGHLYEVAIREVE